MGEWIDFKHLREQLDFGAVLRHFGISLKASSAGQHKGRCPLPSHPKDNSSLSFSANLKRKIWRCFGCNTSGNLLDFAVRMQGGDPHNAVDVREVALRLQKTFFPTSQQQKAPPTVRVSAPKSPTPSPSERVLVNPPLDFALKNLSTDHAFFHKRRLLPATIEHFGLGYCTKGMFSGRVAIPLYNVDGKLVGYVGQLVEDFEVTAEQPLYLWPTERERLGVKHIFDRSRILYHGHAIKAPVSDLIVVQFPESAWWVYQAGFPHVVALLADVPSPEQSAAIVEKTLASGRVWLFPDGNMLGEKCAAELFYDIGQHRFCTWLKLPQGQPSNCSVDDLRATLTWNGSGS